MGEDRRVAGNRRPVRPWRARQVRAWIGAALILVAPIAGLRADERESYLSTRHRLGPTPRFLVAAGSTGDLTARGFAPQATSPWIQVQALDAGGRQHFTDSVPPPSPEAGAVQAIVGGPDRTFVAVSSRARPCESRLYRFRLTADGHAAGLAPVPDGTAPALAGGLAISPDGRRIAYTSAACATLRAGAPLTAPEPARPSTATLTVLDLATGVRRTWTARGPLIVGGIVWARDSRTLGFSTARLRPAAQPSTPPGAHAPSPLRRETIADVAVRALDTGEPGGDLLAGRVLVHPPDDAGRVTLAIMNLDGRTGYGVLRMGDPPSTVLFTFAEGKPMRVTSTIPPPERGTAVSLIVTSADGRPRYACPLNGLDAFGRLIDGEFAGHGFGSCTLAYGY
jgi:hypothetical protein